MNKGIIAASSEAASYRQPAAVLAAACLLSGAGGMIWNVMPEFLGSAAMSYKLTDGQIGWVGSTFMAGFAMLSATSFFWINRFNWRMLAAVGAVLSVLSVAGSALAQNYLVLLSILFIAGLGLGTLYTVGVAITAENHHPDRAFGIKVASETFAGVAMLYVLPAMVIERWGFKGVAITIALVVGLLGFMAIHSIPACREAGTTDGTGGEKDGRCQAGYGWGSWLGLTALFVYVGATTALWAFMERAAPEFGLDNQVTARMLIACLFTQASSALMGAWINDRFGRVLPLTIGMLLAIAGMGVLLHHHDFYAYAVGMLMSVGLSGLAFCYQMGLIASSDVTGRIVTLMPAAMALGGTVGPAVAGSLLDVGSFAPLYWMVAGSIAASLAAFLLLAHILARQSPADATLATIV